MSTGAGVQLGEGRMLMAGRKIAGSRPPSYGQKLGAPLISREATWAA